MSASTVGRMERGDGDAIPVRRWAAAADALGHCLAMVLTEAERARSEIDPVLTPLLIGRLAIQGRWVITACDPSTVVLDRPGRRERLLVFLCDRPIEILDAADVRAHLRSVVTSSPPPGWRLGILVVVRAELPDRYRAMDWMAEELDGFQTTGAQMIAALRMPRVRMPDDDALVWCDEQATRLIPFGLSLEPGRRPPRRRPERRRAACARGC